MRKRSERVLRSERGFTLVELGVVMAIIAILAAIMYPTYTNIKNRAYIAEAKAAMQEIRVEVWAYRVEKEKWPTKGELNPDSYNTDLWGFSVTSGDGEETGDYVIKAEPDANKAAKAAGTHTLTLDTDGKATFAP